MAKSGMAERIKDFNIIDRLACNLEKRQNSKLRKTVKS
jgi:hypothetical protein